MDPYTAVGPSFQPHPEPDMDPYNPVTAYAEPYTPVGPYFKPTPEPPIRNTIPLPLPQAPPHLRPLLVPADKYGGLNFENMNEIPEYTLETVDEFDEGEWDSNHLEGFYVKIVLREGWRRISLYQPVQWPGQHAPVLVLQ